MSFYTILKVFINKGIDYTTSLYKNIHKRGLASKRTTETIQMLMQGKLYDVDDDKINWEQIDKDFGLKMQKEQRISLTLEECIKYKDYRH